MTQQSVATLNATFQFLVIYRYRYIDVCPWSIFSYFITFKKIERNQKGKKDYKKKKAWRGDKVAQQECSNVKLCVSAFSNI